MSSHPTSHHRSILVGLLSGMLLLVLPTAAMAVDAGGLSVTRTDQPGATAPEYVLPLLPGGSAERSVTITNTTGIDVTVLVYGADAEPTDDGLQVADGTDNTSVGAWLTTEEPTLELAGGASINVTFRVTRPDDDEDGGMGALVVQLADESRELLAQPTVQRAAIPVLVAADGTGESVTIGPTTIDGDEAVVTVTNSTPELVTITGEVVHDGFGDETVLATLGPAAISPGATAELRAALDDEVGLTSTLRPFLRIADGAGVLEGPAGGAPRSLLVGGFLLLAAAAIATAAAARRSGGSRTGTRPPPLGATTTRDRSDDAGSSDPDASSEDRDASQEDPDASPEEPQTPDDAPGRPRIRVRSAATDATPSPSRELDHDLVDELVIERDQA